MITIYGLYFRELPQRQASDSDEKVQKEEKNRHRSHSKKREKRHKSREKKLNKQVQKFESILEILAF